MDDVDDSCESVLIGSIRIYDHEMDQISTDCNSLGALFYRWLPHRSGLEPLSKPANDGNVLLPDHGSLRTGQIL